MTEVFGKTYFDKSKLWKSARAIRKSVSTGSVCVYCILQVTNKTGVVIPDVLHIKYKREEDMVL